MRQARVIGALCGFCKALRNQPICFLAQLLIQSSGSGPVIWQWASHLAVGLGMSEPVEPIRQNELAAVMIVHLQLSSQCCRYESLGLQNYSPLPDRIMIKPAALTPCLAWIAFPIPPPLLGYHNEIESCYVTRPHPSKHNDK